MHKIQECIKYKPGTRPPAIRPQMSASAQAHKHTSTQEHKYTKNTKKNIKETQSNYKKNTNQAPSRPPAIRPPTSASTDNINGIPRQEWEIQVIFDENININIR